MTRRKPLPPRVAIGRITGPHGRRGEVRVESLSDFPERFQQLQTVTVTQPQAELELRVVQVRYQGPVLLVKFDGIDSIEEAQSLRGARLEIPLAAVYPLPDGHYYVFQLINLPVFAEDGAFLGYVEEVLPTGGNDVYVVRDPQRQKEILLPATREVIRSIDLVREEIRVRLLPGLGE